MNKTNRHIWVSLQRLRRLEEEKQVRMSVLFSEFSQDELDNVDLGASNSSNLGETLCCFVDYGEDDDKIYEYLEKRG